MEILEIKLLIILIGKFLLPDIMKNRIILGGNILSSLKNINIKYSAETLMKCWSNYFYKKHIKEIIINFIVIFISLLIYFYSEFSVLAELIIFFCVLYLVFIFHFYYNVALSRIKKYKKYYDQMITVLSEDNIQLIGNLSESKTKWEAFTQVSEGKDYYLLFDELGSSLLIPKEVFITEEDKYWFENKLKNSGIDAN